MRSSICCVVLVAVGLTTATTQPANPSIVGLDHIPIAVNDLEAAGGRFRALGFALKPGRPHDNGLRNLHAKFPDGTELELINAPAARDELTAKYRRHLAEGDGPAFLALHAPERQRVREPLPPYVFLAALNHSPTDRPEHFAHANGAVAFISVWLAGDDLSAERRLLQSGGATFTKRRVHIPDPVDADVAQLRDGDVVLLAGTHQRIKGRPIIGATLRVTSAATARKVIEGGGIPVRASATSVFVAPEAANGLWLEFRDASTTSR